MARKLDVLHGLLMSREAAELPTAFVGNINPQRPRTLEEATKQLDQEREKVSQLEKDLRAANREVSKATPLSRELDLSKSKNDEFKAQLAEMRKAVEEGKKAKDMLSKSEISLDATKQTLKMVLGESEELKQKLQQLTDLQLKIQGGEKVLASELALAKAEIQHLRVKENELNVKLKIKGRRLDGIRDKALKSMGNLSLSPPVSETSDEIYFANRQAALEAVIQSAKESTSTTALLLGRSEQQLGETTQKLGELEKKLAESEAKISAALEEGSSLTRELQAQTQKAEAAEKMSATLGSQLERTQSELRRAQALIEEQKKAQRTHAEEQTKNAA